MIYSAVFLVVLVVLLPETFRSMVANGSVLPSEFISMARYPLQAYQNLTGIKWDAALPQLAARKRVDFIGSFRILVSKHAAPIIFFLAIYYAVW